MVDAERIDSRLDRLEHLIELLDEVRASGIDVYLADERLRAMTERWLQLASRLPIAADTSMRKAVRRCNCR